MYCVKNLKDGLYWIGGNDRRIALFENIYPVPNGVSYNSYIMLDEKTVVFDTVDKSVSEVFFENIEHILDGRKLDYLIVNHMEPDHAATIEEVLLRYPDLTIVCNEKAAKMIKQYFNFDIDSHVKLVKEMDVLNTGKHRLRFIMAPMVHWPEVMVTYDETDNVLFSADAFGTFGALNGNVFADELNFKSECLNEARRYYANIVGKYGPQVQALLNKAKTLEIDMICPLHGPVWRKDISWFIEKYQKWSNYTPEENAITIAYASVYGNTENAINIIASKLADRGIKNIKIYDVSATHPSFIISDVFRCSHLVFASTTYNAGIFVNMEALINNIIAHNVRNRTIAIVENGSWAPTAGQLIRKKLSECKDITILNNTVSLRSSLKKNQVSLVEQLVDEICDSMSKCGE